MLTLDPNLISVLTQGGFATLFVWLLITTRNESSKREERLLKLLEQYGAQLPIIAEALGKVEESQERIERRLAAK